MDELVYILMSPITNQHSETGLNTVKENHQFINYETWDMKKNNQPRVNSLQLKLLKLINEHDYSYFFLAEKMLLSCERKVERGESIQDTFEFQFLYHIIQYFEPTMPLIERFNELIDEESQIHPCSRSFFVIDDMFG